MGRKIIIRTKDENKNFIDYLEKISDLLSQAISCIQYPNIIINPSIYKKLSTTKEMIDCLIDDIDEGKQKVYKPSSNTVKYYYKIYYFHSRIDKGEIHVETYHNLKDMNEDEFLIKLVSDGIISDIFANSVTTIIPITRNEYEDGKGYTILFISHNDPDSKYRIAMRCKNKKERNKFLNEIIKNSGWTSDEIRTIKIINDYNYKLEE